MPLLNPEAARRIAAMEPSQKARAIEALRSVIGTRVSVGPAHTAKQIAKRRAYAERGDPQAYIREVLREKLTPQMERVLGDIVTHERILIPSSTGTGKTHLLSCYALYRFDCVAALPSEKDDLEEQGCIVILSAPTNDHIFRVLYGSIRERAIRAERLGWPIPGEMSDARPAWFVRSDWYLRPISPPERAGMEAAPSGAGTHHRNLVILLDDANGVKPIVWRTSEGNAISPGNQIIAPFNPTETTGPTYTRAQIGGGYHVIHLSAFDHPNVRNRSHEAPGEGVISFEEVDRSVRLQCKDIGTPEDRPPDHKHHDFVYALPPDSASERGPRDDGILGHPDGTPRVYRPNGTFESYKLGEWPGASKNSLFDRSALEAAQERWKQTAPPTGPPDRLGCDIAYKEKGDDVALVPSWGDDAASLRLAHYQAQEDGAEALAELKATRRIRVGMPVAMPGADGPTVSSEILERFPDVGKYLVDIGGPGTSAYDSLARATGAPVHGISFGAAAPESAPDEDASENMRAAMYTRFAFLVNVGLVDLPPDPELIEDLLAQKVLWKVRMVARSGEEASRRPSQAIIEKALIRKSLGRSPDKGDAAALSLTDPDRDALPPPGVY